MPIFGQECPNGRCVYPLSTTCLSDKLLPMEDSSTPRSSFYRLVERQLSESLADYVSARRPAQSWRTIAAELGDQIGVEVSHESLRLWFADAEEPAA
jgi:hypothetical protein